MLNQLEKMRIAPVYASATTASHLSVYAAQWRLRSSLNERERESVCVCERERVCVCERESVCVRECGVKES